MKLQKRPMNESYPNDKETSAHPKKKKRPPVRARDCRRQKTVCLTWRIFLARSSVPRGSCCDSLVRSICLD